MNTPINKLPLPSASHSLGPILTLALIVTLISCGPAPAASSPTASAPQPTPAEPVERAEESALFSAGRAYSDISGDMEIPFLDVVGFQANVDEEAQTLEVVLHMRDIPPTAPLGQVTNLLEYLWTVIVYFDPTDVDSTQLDLTHLDYYLSLNTAIDEPYADRTQPIPGTPFTVPINELFENQSIYDSAGRPVGTPRATADPDTDTLILSAHVPGITSRAVFSFSMAYNEDTVDQPDKYVARKAANTSTLVPEEIPTADVTSRLVPVENVRAYPGPDHYAGDVLSFVIKTDGSFGEEPVTVLMSLDGKNPQAMTTTPSWNGLGLSEIWIGLTLPKALDTSNLSGRHMLTFTTADGRLSESYALDVLPADQRPENETDTEWVMSETDCCVFHYLSETAAARDIDFISEHFQQGADDFSSITGSVIDPKLNIYFLDNLWGNGGFGGNGELVISYTDRYYGPTVGAEGLETLARHEFSHAADIGLTKNGDGVDFNYEGMAVYIAGGHYKSEPLAERGAAMYDLGYYVPVGEFLVQHELAYLYPAAMLTYMDETYGKEKMWTFLATDDNPNDDQPGSLEGALQSTFGVSLKTFDQGFQAWLESKDPGEQLDDLRLTIELQDLRRQYQETYAPAPDFLMVEAPSEVARPEYIPLVMREPHAPANIAIELIIADGQQAILHGDYERAKELNKVLADILSTGGFDDPLARDYLEIVLAAVREGNEVVQLEIDGDRAEARVTSEAPHGVDMTFQKVAGAWQVVP